MPNHVMNVIKMKGIENLPLYREEGGDKYFDFNKIIPMPESLDMVSGSIEDLAIETVLRALSSGKFLNKNYKMMKDEDYLERVKNYKGTVDELAKLGLQYITNKVMYGCTTWYDWCCKYWGTKWNAYEFEFIDEDTIMFQTAWSNPEPVLHKLSEMYPDVFIEHWWADEDMGSNSGYHSFEGGEITCGDYNDRCSSEAYETYVYCWGECECIYTNEDGEYCKHDCDTCNGCG